MRSLRARLRASVWFVNTLVFALAAFGIYLTVRSRLETHIDESLTSLIQAAAPTFARRFSDPALSAGVSRVIPGLPAHSLFQIWSISGDELGRSSDLVLDELPRSNSAFGVPELSTIRLRDGAYRVVALRYEHVRPALPPPRGGSGREDPRERTDGLDELPPDELESGARRHSHDSQVGGDRRRGPESRGRDDEGPPDLRNEIDRRCVSIAVPLTDLQLTLDTLRDVLVLSWLVATTLGALLLGFVVKHLLRPLSELKARVAQIDEDGLGAAPALEIRDAPSELEPVIAQLGQFMERMRTALEREQSFSAHAAHELRTPLSGLRATLERLATVIERPGKEDPRQAVDAIHRALAITGELSRLLDALLELSRASGPLSGARRYRVILGPEIESAWLDRSERAALRRLELSLDVPEEFEVDSIPELLRRVIENLLDNAIAYATEGSLIRIRGRIDRTSGTTERVVLEFSNRASDLAPDAALRAFDLFWRGDAARSARDSYGIGLALCRRIVRVLGGTIHAEQSEGEFRIFVALPVQRKAGSTELGGHSIDPD